MKLPVIPAAVTSERLLLRSPRLEDAMALYYGVRESLPELKPWMPWATDDYNLVGCERDLREAIAAFVTGKDLRYHIFERSNGELLGSTGLHRIDWRVPRFEIGYWLRSSKTGAGYVTEAVRALAAMAFEELGANRVDIRCDDRNLASAAVAERCGFELEAILRNWTVAGDGTLAHERVYRRLDASGLEAPSE